MGIESITGSFGFVHGSLIVLIFTYQRASTRPVELLKEEIAFRPSIHVIDALENVQNEKHNTTDIKDIHHNKVDTSEAPLPRAWLCRGKLGSSEQTS